MYIRTPIILVFGLLFVVACGQSRSKKTDVHDASVDSLGTPNDLAQADGVDSGPSPVDGGGAVTVQTLSDGSYVCAPAGDGPFAGVLYNHGGLGDAIGGDLYGTCVALAELGFVARSEQRPLTMSIAGHLDEVLSALDMLRADERVDSGRVGIMGFSRGGLLTLQAAIARPDAVHAIIIMAPAPANGQLEQSIQSVSSIEAPVRILVSENDVVSEDHVGLCQGLFAALEEAQKDVTLTRYPPFENDGHMLFFEVRDPYWADVAVFLNEALSP